MGKRPINRFDYEGWVVNRTIATSQRYGKIVTTTTVFVKAYDYIIGDDGRMAKVRADIRFLFFDDETAPTLEIGDRVAIYDSRIRVKRMTGERQFDVHFHSGRIVKLPPNPDKDE